jgi:hypothetical protein
MGIHSHTARRNVMRGKKYKTHVPVPSAAFEDIFVDLFSPIFRDATERKPRITVRTGRVLRPVNATTIADHQQSLADEQHMIREKSNRSRSLADMVKAGLPALSDPPPRKAVATGPRYFFGGRPARTRIVRKRSASKRWGVK